MSHRTAKRRGQRGAILVFTLAILTGVVAVLAVAAAMQRVSAIATANRVDQQRAELAAESGIQCALSVLAIQSSTATSQNDPWYSLGDMGQDRFTTTDGSFRMQVLDAASFVNLNGATQTQLQNLPLTQAQVDSLLDWEQTGQTARTDGAKDDFYNGLKYPYNTAEKALYTVDEVLQVNNFTPATLFTVQQGVNAVNLPQITLGNESYQPTLYDLATVDSTNPPTTGLTNANTLATGQNVPGLSTGLVNQIVNAKPPQGYSSLGNLFARVPMSLTNAATVLNTLTVTATATAATGAAGGTGAGTALPQIKVDLNTANQAVLQSIPGITSDVAQAIVTRQTNDGFTQLGQVTQVPGITTGILAQCADSFTTNSQVFIVRVIGTVGNVSVPLEAVITLGTNTATITKIYHPAFNNMLAHWHWDNQSTNDVDLRTAG